MFQTKRTQVHIACLTFKVNLINKKKIFNDPVYGFIYIPYDIVFDLIEHPYFQRLRRIKQLGLTHLVYPGALHTRFHHALGAMHLMTQAIDVLRSKGHEITEEEAISVTIAILLHDIGHGPFSHSLERNIIKGLSHEKLSLMFMKKLNHEFNGKLSMAIEIFTNKYPKTFLHQLVSSQLDVDRLDYLKRDCFYTGVSEGEIGNDRIIKMLNIVDDNLVVEHKGIHSIENFLIARKLMYWQVYYHKAVVAAELLVINILKRAKELAETGVELFSTPALHLFLYNKIDLTRVCDSDVLDDYTSYMLDNFAELDDNDIISAIKVWTKSEDKVLALLCKNLINRNLFKIEIQSNPFADEYIDQIKQKARENLLIKDGIDYFVNIKTIENDIYNESDEKINILFKNGTLLDICDSSDQFNIAVLTSPVRKYFLYYPKQLKIVT